MEINIFPIVSSLNDGDRINQETMTLLNEISTIGEFTFNVSSVDDLYNANLSLILVQSGGSEGEFLKMKDKLKPPYYLLTYGSNNSLAASMEILSYLKSLGEEAEILHGSAMYIANRLERLSKPIDKLQTRLGVIGKPSDWLIASNVDYELCKTMYNVELVDVDINELIDLYNNIELDDYRNDLNFNFDNQEVDYAKKMTKALEIIKDKYRLCGLTLRCFELLGTVKTTGCLGLALLNSEDSIGTCEGDIPSMLSMYLMKEIVGVPGFQANPSRIDTDNNQMVFAHCTLPLDMVDSYDVMTHYESGIGVAFSLMIKKPPIFKEI